MAKARRSSAERTYPLGAVTRLTGLSEHVIRAWERRYRAVEPERTPGGTRRYRERDVERLRLLASAVAEGHQIGDIAALSEAELRGRLRPDESPSSPALPRALTAIDALDYAAAESVIALQLAALGPARFAREFAVPLLNAIGEAYAASKLCIASEHMASALLRSLLGGALRPTLASSRAPTLVFGTPAGDRHDLGILIAALTAQAAGGNPLFLGPDLPAEELIDAVATTDAAALVLGLAVLPAKEATRALRSIRAGLPDDVELWVGGAAAGNATLPEGVDYLADLDQLEHKVSLLNARRGA